jgi:geranylgeranyl transferase type-1 subunit beta
MQTCILTRQAWTGGTTYCVIASLHLCNKLRSLPNLQRTIDWLIHRIIPLDPELLDAEDYETESDPDGEIFLHSIEDGRISIAGFQGRPEKSPDACYSFWVGASLQVRLVLHLCRRSTPWLSRRIHLQLAMKPGNVAVYEIEAERKFLLLCQSKMGGIAKFPGEYSGLSTPF